ILRGVTLRDCKADYVNLSEIKADRMLLTGCAMPEAAVESANLKNVKFTDCDLTRATLFSTPMKGIDMTTCTLDGILVNLLDLRGMVVTSLQASELAKLLGLVVK
ncbi:MAG: pentapeptide repeat-containing protein, partial [Clostridia bacterium]|nr:pentapeptide repeat-containing protein [Clostridia bacterium]